MTAEPVALDIEAAPTLSQLVDEVERTRRPYVLRRGNEDIAMLVPVPPRVPRRRGKSHLRYPTVASLAGAAGTLARPMSWDEIKGAIRDERAEAYLARRHE